MRLFRVFLVIISLILFTRVCYTQPLLDYIDKPDDTFSWNLISSQQIGDVSFYEIEVHSQIWKGIPWTHRLIIGSPKDIQIPNMALLFITGDWKGLSSEELKYIKEISEKLGTVSAVLFDVPNQPLFGGLREDALIAYTFSQFAKTQDKEMPLLLPMVKSAVKAMDTIQDFSKRYLGLVIDSFVVTGASKRGWTTWLVGASDKRVKGIAPMVYDNLNIIRQFEHQKEIWGDYSPQLGDYTSLGLERLGGTPIGNSLLSIVDPYFYRERITMPKLIINGTNDPYWTIDATSIYLDELKGKRYILYVPNSGHELQDRSRVINEVSAFYLYISGKISFPTISWNVEEDKDTIRVNLSSDINPERVGIWYATSLDRRFVSSLWQYVEGKASPLGYTVEIDKPKDGNIAIFGELTYNIVGLEFYLCSPAIIR
ncbi:MAG: PhoPQ-activated pathogenicity-related family protein [bacterium]